MVAAGIGAVFLQEAAGNPRSLDLRNVRLTIDKVMTDSPLPKIVPLFPLTGVLLLPGMWLPLHIFEPRYRNMVADVRSGDGYIGLVQPVVPRQDNRPPPDAVPGNPPVYPVGCLGRMEQCDEKPDGRYLINLKGISRFRAQEELDLEKGYRRVTADYAEYAADLTEMEIDLDPASLIHRLTAFSKVNRVSFDLARLGGVPGIALLNGLSMSLPFAPAEKQALLEAPRPSERERLLLRLLEMGLEGRTGEEHPLPPTLN
jgi:Lon protease-like protein